MENFISIVWNKKQVAEVDEYLVDAILECAEEGLLEDETMYESYNTINDGIVLTVGLHKALSESESNVVAERVANKLFDLGYNNFDIEISI
jgi:hypothetical protein